MTDKEQIINNFVKDINVPSKEQIIIDGVDVSECFHYINNKEYTCRLNHTPFHYRHCEENPNCYFKQLARKTQECELLSENLKIKEDEARHYLGEGYKYRNALEKIEGLVKNFCKDCNDYEDCNWDKEGCYYSLIPNLKDIINKVKEGK